MNAATSTHSTHSTVRPVTFTLLRLLIDGKFHSGEMLAQRLGMSRTSVNNALREVGKLGLVLYSVRGRGYCLPDPPQWLNADTVLYALSHRGGKKIAAPFQIEILDRIPSTNTLLLQRSTQGAPSGSVLAAEWQDNGRGRLGRQWHSGLGNALTFSLLWRFECGLSGLSGLSLAIGVAIIRALKKWSIKAQLKWPNDVLSKNAKLAGILLEAQGDMLGPSAVVIGIGINILTPENVRAKIDQPVISLADLIDPPPERNHLLAMLLAELDIALRQFAVAGFSAFRKEWESCHALQGQKITLSLPDGNRVTGIARGVTDSGALILETAQGVRMMSAGEINIGEINIGEINIGESDVVKINARKVIAAHAKVRTKKASPIKVGRP